MPHDIHANGLSLFLCGDVVTARGIDQVLPHPGNPLLHERSIRDAREYVELAERVHGPIARPVGFEYIWGDALVELNRFNPDVRIINLETSVTRSDDFWPGKEVHYRMHPKNIGCITAAGIDCCCLANNHVLDWGHEGLRETLQTLDAAGLRHAGAGRDALEARTPVPIEVAGKGRVLVFAFGAASSGVPLEWAATDARSGVNLLGDLSKDTARAIGIEIRKHLRPDDVAVASIHWGGNWGYGIPEEQIAFAHQLIEEGVAVVHGHSSHHVKGLEVYRKRLILYGCGDFINDYEGIGGFEPFRGDLTLMYCVTVDPADGHLVRLRLVPLCMRGFQLHRAAEVDTLWLLDLLNRLGAELGTRVVWSSDNDLTLCWQ